MEHVFQSFREAAISLTTSDACAILNAFLNPRLSPRLESFIAGCCFNEVSNKTETGVQLWQERKKYVQTVLPGELDALRSAPIFPSFNEGLTKAGP